MNFSHIRLYDDIYEQKSEDDGTPTTFEQMQVENHVLKAFEMFEKRASINPELPCINRREHGEFLKKALIYLPNSYECLDASRPWLCYWILNSLWLLHDLPDDKTLSNVVKFLEKCQHKNGGYGGGPGQYPHLAPTYAAINALAIIGTEEAFESINRSTLTNFLWNVRSSDGGFAMHEGGEVDIRGVYCALNVAYLTNVQSKALFDKTAEWIISCQTYEGGFSGSQGMEAHGGYAFCALAALILLGKSDLCDLDALLRWVVNRQMKLEGGFQGRTNKLVDGCYSFWQGAAFLLIHNILTSNEETKFVNNLLFNQGALQEYILVCCENPTGGFIDKPGKPRDLYHTNYVLSGLSIAQYGHGHEKLIIGSESNKLNMIHPTHCIAVHKAYEMAQYFSTFPPCDSAST